MIFTNAKKIMILWFYIFNAMVFVTVRASEGRGPLQASQRAKGARYTVPLPVPIPVPVPGTGCSV